MASKDEIVSFMEDFIERGCELLGVESPFGEDEDEGDEGD